MIIINFWRRWFNWLCKGSFRRLLKRLQESSVEVTTPFGVTSGTLVAVRKDYIVIIENSDRQVLIAIRKIETIQSVS
ncbi:hypothetical protein [Geomicrobium sediminis]|uniref:Precorrin-2 methylase n=1 Tax=Geomicrobium sediminis TaxID=1347788 RepID=A0ABS2PIB0_9BACL|nr:hypothetical protein [Geomicrobium sediminis]EZH65575.1 hypothetical protein DH09_18320 [Bacillaceae bacterium JMAK1]MBM7635169.1 precorrin-2 methylase [Geomicrobium sediminis]